MVMVRRVMTILVLLLVPYCVKGMTVHMAPVLYIDETKDMLKDHRFAYREILRELHGIETGMVLNFTALSDELIAPPQSMVDAATVCRNEKADFLLYGFIVKRDYTIQIEIKLFDYSNREIIRSFYAIDDHGNYERMIGDVAVKIVSYFNETFNLGLAGGRGSFVQISMPASVGYWTPLGSRWNDLLIGTGAVTVGFEIIPSDNCFIAFGKRFYFSTGIEAEYRLGLGRPDAYSGYYHSILLTVPVRLHLAVSEHHSFFMGAAFQYVLDILSVEEPYADAETRVYNNLGAGADIGYQLHFSERVSFYFDNLFTVLFTEEPLFSYSPHLGVKVMLYTKELKRTW
ncbi:hypothetical protein [Breznakiella homolactica]|uniref:Uncharacterized protein n=1 Tax=Breznakiella homolactica TaxID=2798577 RepID=A0A7T7XRB2_9SPIR|nr:hypothetical protein [Breznakiella homolactica]QQO11004.1 hypothetical protein JFL75_08825 [Breznakiella homolactica]